MRKALLVALTVAIIWPSAASAADTVVDAGSMTLGTGMELRGAYIAFLSDGTPATRSITVDRVTQVTVSAWARLCDGAPVAIVSIDGKVVANITVTGTMPATYSAAVTVPAGTHTLGLQFQSDAYLSDTCDRNLYVDKVILSGADPTPTPAPTSTPSSTTPPEDRPFPRLFMVHQVITDPTDAANLAKWDWVVLSKAYPSSTALIPTLRAANRKIKVSLYTNASEDEDHRSEPDPTLSPTAYSSGFTDGWWLRNADGSYATLPWNPENQMLDLSQFCPVVAGKTWSDYLVQWIAANYHEDGVFVDIITDPSLNGVYPYWKLSEQVPDVDLDRDGIPDVAEHGAQWVDDQWAQGARAFISRLRALIGPDQIIIGNNGMGFNSLANGNVLETGVMPEAALTALQSWETNHFGPYYSAALTPASDYSSSPQTDYKLMRHNLASALMAGSYFGYADGNGPRGGYSTLWWYDEYSVDLATGTATGDASHKGYLGQPLGPAQRLSNGIWRRDFDHGIALINMTNSTQSVDLGGTFRRIHGTQDPVTNNGATVTSVTLSGQDAIILLRDPPDRPSTSLLPASGASRSSQPRG